MKLSRQPRNRVRGVATLLVIALVACITGSGLVYFLRNAQQETIAVERSRCWNTALALAEAGIEEGLTLVNHGSWQNNTTYASDGWSLNGNVYSISRSLSTITNSGYYTVYVTNTASCPVIFSIGSAYGTDASMKGDLIRRAVVVATTDTRPFPGALTLQQQVDFNGQNVTVDSYDSRDPYHSYWPDYPSGLGYGVYTNTASTANGLRKANGNVATDGAIVGIINIGNANVFGHVDTGPGGTVVIGARGSVGDTTWVPGTIGIMPGYQANDMNVRFDDVTLPSASWSPLANNTSITNSGYYMMGQINNNMTISASNVVLYLVNGIQLGGNQGLTVETNASVTIYASGVIDDGGNGFINNKTQHPSQMLIWGLPTLESIKLNGNGAFWGAIYAPDAAVEFKGAGNDGGYYGALTAYKIKMTGNANFSYDEALGMIGSDGYIVTSWQEVTNF